MTEIDHSARLALVQAAIEALLAGRMAEYEIDGQRVTYLDLGKLLAEEKRLQALIGRQEARGSAFMRAAPR
jgi:hypothetical protein